ncbi:VOC family protein [Novosphingobium terrae]|uniref:VOC family protein n=1 Tax=Novosphingobium terrae TaxID=2726189 RepID=UPI00197FE48B|nr:VOC family protein [Novosphingobium terrae]
MHVERIGHVNIRTPLVEETLVFYETYLGLRRGDAVSAVWRADNVWLYDAQGFPLIHVNGPLPDEIAAPEGLTSRLDHVAFDCSGLKACRERLTAGGIAFREQPLPARQMHQLNLLDPNGIKVELTFRDDEVDA